jgi:hypothetical protein
MDKHCSLLRKFVNYGQKSFITLAPNVISQTMLEIIATPTLEILSNLETH